MIAFSPPYWGQRVYDGCPPTIWPARTPVGMNLTDWLERAACEHEWRADPGTRGNNRNFIDEGGRRPNNPDISRQSATCIKCGAWRGCLGLEPTVAIYIEHLMLVMAECRRVLRDDGTCWVNLGDTFASGKGTCNNPGGGTESLGLGRKDAGAYPLDRGNKSTLTARGLKPKDLCLVPARFAIACQEAGWWVRSDIIWCLSGGTMVYAQTQKGEMPMSVKDMVRLRPGTIKLWNGEKWTQALGWNCAASRSGALEIEFRSGERVGCTSSHQWPTDRGLVRADELRKGDVVATCRLPGRNHANPSYLRTGIGWYVGHYLAEGSLSRERIQIACHKDEMQEVERQWGAFAEAYGGSAHSHCAHGNAGMVVVHSLIVKAIIHNFISGRTAKNKGFQTAIWQFNDMFLSDVLEGYLDGDGHFDEKNNRWRIGFTRNEKLAAGLRTICARLGVQCRLRTSHATCNGKRFPRYRGEIRYRASHHGNAKHNGEVIAIRKSRARQFWHIGVADEPHTFALASGILTHNSKPNPMPESCTDRPSKSHEYIWLLTKRPQYHYDAEAVRERGVWPAGTRGGKGSQTRCRESGVSGRPPEYAIYTGSRSCRSVWHIATQAYVGAHFATWPEKLAARMIQAGSAGRNCPHCGAPWERSDEKAGQSQRSHPGGVGATEAKKGNAYAVKTLGFRPTCFCPGNDGSAKGIVLDPFVGSGTTVAVAAKLGRKGIGLDLSMKYLTRQARKRVRQASLQKVGAWAL